MSEMAWRYAKKVSYTEVIVPHTVDLGIVKKKFEFIMPENSAGIIRLKPLEKFHLEITVSHDEVLYPALPRGRLTHSAFQNFRKSRYCP